MLAKTITYGDEGVQIGRSSDAGDGWRHVAHQIQPIGPLRQIAFYRSHIVLRG